MTIVEAAPAPVARILGNAVGHMLAARWRDHGVDVRLHTGVASFRADANGRIDSVVLTDGSELRADVVLVGVGVEPVRELLPERPALHVHPAGDIVGPGHWTAAALDGAAAARRILGLPVAAPPPHYVWSDQFGLRLQVVGSPDPDDRSRRTATTTRSPSGISAPTGARAPRCSRTGPAEAAEIRRFLADEALACAA